MNEQDHNALVAVAQRWEQLAADKDAEIAQLKKTLSFIDSHKLIAERFEMLHEMTYHEMCGVIARLRGALQAAQSTAEIARDAWLRCLTQPASKALHAETVAAYNVFAKSVAAGTALGQEARDG